MSDNNAAANAMLVEVGTVKGTLTSMTELIRQNHQATQTRIEDLSKSVAQRFDGLEERLSVLEKNERGTALRGASGGAVSAAIVTGGIELMKFLASGH